MMESEGIYNIIFVYTIRTIKQLLMMETSTISYSIQCIQHKGHIPLTSYTYEMGVITHRSKECPRIVVELEFSVLWKELL